MVDITKCYWKKMSCCKHQLFFSFFCVLFKSWELSLINDRHSVCFFLLILCIACMTCQAGLNCSLPSLGSMPPIAFQVESDSVYNLDWLEEPWCSVWRQPQWGTSADSSTIVNRTGLSFIWQLKASFFCQDQTCVWLADFSK